MDSKDSGYICFLIVLNVLKVTVSENLKNEYSSIDGTTEYKILRTAKKLNLKAKAGKINLKKLDALNVPVIIQQKNGSYILLIGRDKEKYVVLDPAKGYTEKIDSADLIADSTGDVIIIGKKLRNATDDAANCKFGFKWFIPTIMKFKKQFICVLIAVFFIQILGILTPLMTQVVVDKVLSHNALNTLYTIAIGILIVYIYELIISICKNYLFVHTTNRIDVVLSSRLFHHLFALPLKYFESRRVGDTVARVRELDHIRSFLTGTPLQSMVDALFIVVYIAVMFFYSTNLTWIVVASLPIFAILSIIVTPMFKKRLDKKFETGANAQSFLVESINGVHTVKSFALEHSFEEKWGDLQSEYVKAGYKTSMVSQTSNSIASFVQHVVDLLVLVFGAKAVINGTLTIGQLVAFRMLAGRVSGPVLRLVQLWQEYQQASLSVRRIGDIFNSLVERSSDKTLSRLPALQGNIKFENVRFRYRMDSSDVLHGISFEMKENRVYGLVGRSGSGKSTISKLIQRLYIPQSGKISIDGFDLSLINPQALRQQIGIVLQESFMFNGTVAENISIHCPDASMEKIVAAAKIAGAHDFITELEEGYNTMIGEKGISLSGGQKQRVAIARAIINNPKILIFDEATSALDYESESIIQHNLKDICRNRTVLIIAHRLSTLSIADKIIVIDRGEFKESGSHAELMSAGGLYAYLYNQQLKGEVEA